MFVNTENKPSVIKLSGKLIMLKIGLSTRVRNISDAPPIRNVKMPPLTVSDGSTLAVM